MAAAGARRKSVKVTCQGVKIASTTAALPAAGPSFINGPCRRGPSGCCLERNRRASRLRSIEWRNMSVVVYIVLTVAIFGLLGLVQKLVERL